jgi:hypothetical protein
VHVTLSQVDSADTGFALDETRQVCEQVGSMLELPKFKLLELGCRDKEALDEIGSVFG